MTESKQKVLILGGTGFVGYYVIRAFSENGFELGVMLHKRKDDLNIPYDGYKTFTGDIADSDSIAKVINEFRPDVIIHLVGIMRERGRQTYKNIHVKGTRNIVDAVKNAGIPDEKIIYVSALGADTNGSTEYYRTKAQAEEIIKNSDLNYTIFRPAMMFGWRSQFTGRIVRYAKIFQVFPYIATNSLKVQLVAAETTAKAVTQAAGSKGTGKTYEIVGPDELTMRELTERIREKTGSVKPIVPVPLFLARMAAALGALGLPTPVKRAELKMVLNMEKGSSAEFKNDFELEDIAFDPLGEYPLY